MNRGQVRGQQILTEFKKQKTHRVSVWCLLSIVFLSHLLDIYVSDNFSPMHRCGPSALKLCWESCNFWADSRTLFSSFFFAYRMCGFDKLFLLNCVLLFLFLLLNYRTAKLNYQMELGQRQAGGRTSVYIFGIVQHSKRSELCAWRAINK